MISKPRFSLRCSSPCQSPECFEKFLGSGGGGGGHDAGPIPPITPGLESPPEPAESEVVWKLLLFPEAPSRLQMRYARSLGTVNYTRRLSSDGMAGLAELTALGH